MLLRHLSLLALCAPADDTPAPVLGGAPAPAASEPPTPQVPEPSPVKPGVIATAAALLRGANGSAAQIVALRADLTTRDATIADLTAQLTTRDATIAAQLTELQAFRTQAADLQAAVTALEAKQTDVQTEVIHQLAAAGLPEAQLPKGSTSAHALTSEELWKQAEATDDPIAKGKLAAQAMALDTAKKKN